MPARICSAAINGIDAQLVEVEVDSTPGIFSLNIVGLPDKAVEESKDRIASAIRNSGFEAPNSKNKKIIINLAPADLKKEGPAYDLPIAMGFLSETKQVKFDSSDKLFAGELSLNGEIKHTNGILAMAVMAKKSGFKEMIVPHSNVREAAAVEGIEVIGVKDLSQAIHHLNATQTIKPHKNESFSPTRPNYESFLMIKGQEYAKRALAIAAAGSHNIIMAGPPGGGKTLLARALAEILPPLTFEEALEVAKIYSSVGMIKDSSIPNQRPFRAPHHTTSAAAVIGGGAYPKPGEISLAHRGVLFFDELPEFPRHVLEALRQPLEEGVVTVSRASGSALLPARFMFVAAMNPCPCGNYGEERAECICSPFNILRYRKKVSGPLLDRIDIQINVSRETVSREPGDIEANRSAISALSQKITRAREMQLARFNGTGIYSNSEMDYKNVERYCPIEPNALKLLKRAIDVKNLSLRAYHKILKISRTIADLEAVETIKENHVAEAISLRINDNLFTELG